MCLCGEENYFTVCGGGGISQGLKGPCSQETGVGSDSQDLYYTWTLVAVWTHKSICGLISFFLLFSSFKHAC